MELTKKLVERIVETSNHNIILLFHYKDKVKDAIDKSIMVAIDEEIKKVLKSN